MLGRHHAGHRVVWTSSRVHTVVPPVTHNTDSRSSSNYTTVGLHQGFMQDKTIARHTCFGGHMDVNCQASLQTFKYA